MNEPRWRRAMRLFGPDPRADVDDEFAFHLAERTEALIAKGMSETAAREQALRQFGDLQRAAADLSEIGKRRARRAHWRERIGSVAQDFVYAVKGMRRSPGFTLAAIATIALGIGANTAVFSLLNVLLFRPIDASHPRELVRVYTSEGRTLRDERDRFGGSSYADYVDLSQARSLSGLAAFAPLGASIQIDGVTIGVEARIVSENYFSLLGRPLLLGGWGAVDVLPGSPEVIVSHRLWTTTLGADPAAVGRSLTVNGRTVRVAGVTSASFKGAEPSTIAVYVPFRSAPEIIGRPGFLTERGERSVRLLGRLAPAATARSAEQELDGIMRRLAEEYPGSNARRSISVREATSVIPLELMGGGLLPTAGLVFGATLVMLVISGVNVAAVLLARTVRRRRELAVRVSLGAGPLRIVRQLVTESVALALAAAIVVVALVSWLPVLAGWLGVPLSVQPTADVAVLAYAVAVAVGFGVIFGLGPALIGIRSSVVESLRGGDASSRPTRARAQRVLVRAQLALSMLLLVVGGGLLGSLARQQRVNPGFTVDRLVVATFEDPSGISDRGRTLAFTRLAVERLSAIPGVTSVSVTNMPPLTSEGARGTTHIPGYAEQPDENMEVAMAGAGPDFFKTLGIPIRRGRELTWNDRDTLTRVVVNASMARRYWGDRDPVGSFVHLGGRGGAPAEVIGVADDARFISLAQPPQAMYFIQRASGGDHAVLIRTRGDPSALLLAVRGSMSQNDVPLTLSRVRTMEDILRSSLSVARAVSDTLMAIGVLAVLLAAVGLFGVVSYVVTGRTREFGVRLALGATPSSITRLILGYGIRLAALGGMIGIILGLGALQMIEGMLFGSWSSLPLVATVGVVLSAVTLVACAIPALRASKTSPVISLRSE